MREMTQQFLNLFFDAGETICVSDCQGGYHSIPQKLDRITLVSPKEDKKDRIITESDINLVAINPVKGWRRDKCVTSFRSFLVELDEGSLPEQKKYVEDLGLPYSICVFSGNKSLHYGIVLSENLAGESVWRFTNKWILNIVKKADQQTLNPTRSIRFPGNIRKDGKQLMQALVEMKRRISPDELYAWLNQFPECKPKPKKQRTQRRKLSGTRRENLAKWVMPVLESGIYSERNNTWFKVACAFAHAGYGQDDAEDILSEYFQEESDFKEYEWKSCIASGFKKVLGD
jgi:hypothetical protein